MIKIDSLKNVLICLLLFISCTEVSNRRPHLKDTIAAEAGVKNKLVIPEISLQTFNQLPKGMEVGAVMYYLNQHKSRSYIFLRNDNGSAVVKVNEQLIALKRTKEYHTGAEWIEEYKGGGLDATFIVKKKLALNGVLQNVGTLKVTNGFKKVSVSVFAKVNDERAFKN